MIKFLITTFLASSLLFSMTVGFAAPSSPELKGLVSGYFDNYLKDLEYITNIDSGSGNAEGSAQIADFLKTRLEESGAAVEYRTNDKGTHVIARIKGEGTLKLLMMAHTDTVFEKGEAAKRPFHVDENLIAKGPGVGDDKATVVQTLYTVKALQDINFKNYGEIIVYFAAEEETGSVTEDAIITELSQQADMCVVMDTARPNWGIVSQRKGQATYQIKVEGISGHAGNAPQRSASAIMELGNQISMLYKLASPLPQDPTSMTDAALAAKGIKYYGQFIPENTINIGVIGTTNTKTNVVPDNAFAKLEVRGYKLSELERIDKEIKALNHKTVVPGTKVTITGGIAMGPMEKTLAVQKIIDIYKNIAKTEYNANVVEFVAGGLTDGNLSAKYIPTIDALGIENYDEHTANETVDLKTVTPRTVVLVEFIQQLANELPAKK